MLRQLAVAGAIAVPVVGLPERKGDARMCGRYTVRAPGQIALRFGVPEANVDGAATAEARYNVAPSQAVPVVVARDGGRAVQALSWGFRPAWMRDPQKPAPINARAETLLERPLFKGAVLGHRCLVPADGFYEWQVRPGQKRNQPYYIRLRDESLFAFAGLYTGPSGSSPGTCVLITTAPNELMVPFHDRMPAILRPEDEAAWLDPELRQAEIVTSLLRSYPEELMVAYPVGPLVSTVANDGPALVEPQVVS